MPSVREGILRAIGAALAGNGTPAVKVTRSQIDQIDAGSALPGYDFTADTETVHESGEYTDRNGLTRVLTVVVRGIIDATEPSSAPDAVVDDSGLDPLYIFAVQNLTGNLGGAAIDCEEKGAKLILQPGGRAIIGLEMTFEVTFATRRGDPTQEG